MKTVKNVDEFIASAPKEIQPMLNELRKAIKNAAPNSEEKISYQMPSYSYKGRLVYFGFWKKHIGFYITPPIIEIFKKELKNYETHKATIRFPLEEKLPLDLITKLVKARVKMNEDSKKGK